jgi:hypothetical protein
MPRDGNGTYVLVSGNPVAPGTTIEDAWANSTLSDIAAALTDSLSRTGQGGMQYPLTFGDGTVSAPGIAWTNETGSGLYRAAAADMRVSLQGYGDTFRWYQGVAYARNAADTAWSAVVYAGGAGSVPVGVAALDTLVWDTVTSNWIRQVKNAGGSLPVGSATLTALQWDNVDSVWEAVTPTTFTSNIDDGTVTGQTPVWNNSTTQWEPTSLLFTSTANSAVAIGTSMTTAAGVSLNVLNTQWIGDAAGTAGLNLYNYGGIAATIYAGTRAAPLVASIPLVLAGSVITFTAGANLILNSTSGDIVLQNNAVTRFTFDEAGHVGIGVDPTTIRLRVKSTAGDAATVQFVNSAGDESFGMLDNGQIRMINLPTSSAGLPSGTLWHHVASGEMRIAP